MMPFEWDVRVFSKDHTVTAPTFTTRPATAGYTTLWGTTMIGAAHGMDTSDYTIPYVATWAQSVADKEPVDVVRETGERVRRVALEILDKLPDAGIGDGYPPGLDRTGPDAERETSRARTVELGTATPVRTTATVDVSVPAL